MERNAGILENTSVSVKEAEKELCAQIMVCKFIAETLCHTTFSFKKWTLCDGDTEVNETRGSDFKDRSLKNASREETLRNVGSVASPLEKKVYLDL